MLRKPSNPIDGTKLIWPVYLSKHLVGTKSQNFLQSWPVDHFMQSISSNLVANPKQRKLEEIKVMALKKKIGICYYLY